MRQIVVQCGHDVHLVANIINGIRCPFAGQPPTASLPRWLVEPTNPLVSDTPAGRFGSLAFMSKFIDVNVILRCRSGRG
jgi:hypothetical protein